jgi:hypothetical protein
MLQLELSPSIPRAFCSLSAPCNRTGNSSPAFPVESFPYFILFSPSLPFLLPQPITNHQSSWTNQNQNSHSPPKKISESFRVLLMQGRVPQPPSVRCSKTTTKYAACQEPWQVWNHALSEHLSGTKDSWTDRGLFGRLPWSKECPSGVPLSPRKTPGCEWAGDKQQTIFLFCTLSAVSRPGHVVGLSHLSIVYSADGHLNFRSCILLTATSIPVLYATNDDPSHDSHRVGQEHYILVRAGETVEFDREGGDKVHITVPRSAQRQPMLHPLLFQCTPGEPDDRVCRGESLGLERRHNQDFERRISTPRSGRVPARRIVTGHTVKVTVTVRVLAYSTVKNARIVLRSRPC